MHFLAEFGTECFGLFLCHSFGEIINKTTCVLNDSVVRWAKMESATGNNISVTLESVGSLNG